MVCEKLDYTEKNYLHVCWSLAVLEKNYWIEKYKEEFIYNADESGFCFISLPWKTLSSATEKFASGIKLSEKRMKISVGKCNRKLSIAIVGDRKI